MRAIFVGLPLTAFFVTPALADYYIIQEPTGERPLVVPG